MTSIKWVITNKGTEERPIAKARLVAREFNTADKRGELFAGTPGLMAMRTVISRAMTKGENGANRTIMLADVDDLLCTGVRDDLMWLETLFMGEDNDMVKNAVYLGRTLE